MIKSKWMKAIRCTSCYDGYASEACPPNQQIPGYLYKPCRDILCTSCGATGFEAASGRKIYFRKWWDPRTWSIPSKWEWYEQPTPIQQLANAGRKT